MVTWAWFVQNGFPAQCYRDKGLAQPEASELCPCRAQRVWNHLKNGFLLKRTLSYNREKGL